MKLSVALICLSVVVAVTLAETGQYVPRGFYTIDGDGNASPMAYITEAHKEVLRRFRRSPGGYSSSSISSFSQPGQSGQPGVFFQQTGTFLDSPGSNKRPYGQITTSQGYIDHKGNVQYTHNKKRYA